MKRLRFVLPIMLLLLVGAVLADPIVALTTYMSSPSIASPGTTGYVSVTFTNIGDEVASNLRIFYGELGGTASIGPKSAGDLAKGTSTTVVIPFSVSANSREGVYALPLLVFYGSATSANFVIPITVSTPTAIQVITNNISKSTLKSGESFDVSLTVNNLGGDIKNAVLSVPQESAFQFSGVSKYQIPTLASNSSASLVVSLISNPNTTTGRYTAPLSVSYENAFGLKFSENATIGPFDVVDVSTLFVLTVKAPEGAEVGSAVPLNVTIFNNGQDDESDVIVEAGSSSSLTPLGSNKLLFSKIPAKGESSQTLYIGVNPLTQPGYYTLPFTVRFRSGQSFTSDVGIQIQAASQLNLAWVTNPRFPTPGSTADLSIDITNIGDSEIRSVIVSLSSDTIQITGDSSRFIGTLNIDDTGNLLTSIHVPLNTSKGLANVIATITFKDSNNQEHRIDKAVGIEIVSSDDPRASVNATIRRTTRPGAGTGGISPLQIATGLAVVLIVAFLAYRWWHGKRKKS